MDYIYLLLGILMVCAAILLFWFVRPVDGKVNPRLNPLIEPYAAVLILGLAAFGLITTLFEIGVLLG
jgi:hypothetical protein